MDWKSAIAFVLLLAFVAIEPSREAFSATVPSVQPDKGLVVFYRARKAKGAAMRFQISDSGGVSVGNLSNGSVLHRHFETGQKTFDVSTPSVAGSDLITLDIVAGERYFVKGEILWGWPAGRPKFSRVPESQALSEIAKL